MKYFSEKTKELYESVAELEKAETYFDKQKQAELEKKNLRAKRAKEVEDAFRAANEARTKANELLVAFNKDYGSFHMTLKDGLNFDSLFELFF